MAHNPLILKHIPTSPCRQKGARSNNKGLVVNQLGDTGIYIEKILYFCTANLKNRYNMIKSMTGYGKAEAILETGKITVEVRSLNGKTADISLKTSMLPKDKEMAVRQKIAAALTRGNIDFFITFEPNAADNAKKINIALAME